MDAVTPSAYLPFPVVADFIFLRSRRVVLFASSHTFFSTRNKDLWGGWGDGGGITGEPYKLLTLFGNRMRLGLRESLTYLTNSLSLSLSLSLYFALLSFAYFLTSFKKKKMYSFHYDGKSKVADFVCVCVCVCVCVFHFIVIAIAFVIVVLFIFIFLPLFECL